MPGVMMIKPWPRHAALLAFMSLGRKPDDNAIVYFAGIDGARFNGRSSPAASSAWKSNCCAPRGIPTSSTARSTNSNG